MGDTPVKGKGKEKDKGKKRQRSKGKSAELDDADFQAPVSDAASESDGTEDAVMDADDIHMLPIPGFSSPPPSAPGPSVKQSHPRHRHTGIPQPVNSRQGGPETQEEFCGLCGEQHAHGRCPMTESPENLAMYRLMLLSHAGDETIEERVCRSNTMSDSVCKFLTPFYSARRYPSHRRDTSPAWENSPHLWTAPPSRGGPSSESASRSASPEEA